MRKALLFCLAALATLSALSQPTTIRVGIYDNPPLTMTGAQGQPAGYLIDVLEEIARQEGWQLSYQAYTFAEALQALRAGRIDLLPAVAWSPQRDSLFTLNRISVLTNWGKLYKHEDDERNYLSVEDLRGTTIAALRGDIYLEEPQRGLRSLLRQLSIPARIIETTTYEAALDSVVQGRADLVLLSRYYGILHTNDRPLVKTPINIAYTSVRYAFAPGPQYRTLADALDSRLQQLMADRSSIYYSSAKNHLSYQPQDWLPPWLWQVLATVLAGLLVLVVFVILLQHQVKKKTRELRLTNRELVHTQRGMRLAEQTIEASQDIGFWFQPGGKLIRVNQAAMRLTGFDKDELLGMYPRDLLATTANQHLYDKINSPDGPAHLLLEDRLRKKNGDSFPVEISLDRFTLDGQIYICGFARDITSRVKAQQELLERNKELQCLYRISQLGTEPNCTDETIFTGAIAAMLPAWQYPDKTCVQIQYKNKEFKSANYRQTPWQLSEPLLMWGQEMGHITVGYTDLPADAKNSPFLDEEVSLLQGVGKLLGSILESKDAERQIIASILATEDQERSRIAKELHDSVGQTLSALALHLNNLKKDRHLNKDEKDKLARVDSLLKAAIGETRSVAHNLMPPTLTDLGFVAAVDNLIARLQEASEIKFTFHTNQDASQDIPTDIAFALYRIVQEALNNIIKHAKASEVTIQFLVYDDLLSLSVEDNGKGFDKAKSQKNSNFGINSMRNRAASIGADISIDSHPGQGTHIHVSVPL